VQINVSNCNCNNILTGHTCLAVLLISQVGRNYTERHKISVKFEINIFRRKVLCNLCSVTSACTRRTENLWDTDWCQLTDFLNKFSAVISMWIVTLKLKHTHFMLCTLFKQQPLQNNNAYLSSSLAIRWDSSGKIYRSAVVFFTEVTESRCVLVYTVNVVGYRLSWKKGIIYLYICELMYWRDWVTNYGKEGENSAIRQINWRPLQCTFFPWSSEDVSSVRRWVRPKWLSEFYTTRKAQ
jgi:hypothetical protein